MGGTFIKSALVSKEGSILKTAKVLTEANQNRETVVANLRRAFEEVYVQGILGIGIGSPGCVDPESGKVGAVDNIPCLNDFCLKSFLGEKNNIPIFVDNDANNAAKGEYLFGNGKGTKHFMALTLGTGVGSGLILNECFYRGNNNYAGELGHMTYIPDGMACTCGKRGCLEAYASATALIRNAKSMIKRQLSTKLTQYDPEQLDAHLICDLAKQGDELCQSILQDMARALGTVIGTVINLLNLECIVIGGGVLCWRYSFTPLRLYASRHALPLAYTRCRILPSQLGNEANLLGCAASVVMGLQ